MLGWILQGAEWILQSAGEPLHSKFQVFLGHGDLEPVTQTLYIVPIVVIQFVTGVEFHEPLWGNAAHREPADHSTTRQVLLDVRHAADVPT